MSWGPFLMAHRHTGVWVEVGTHHLVSISGSSTEHDRVILPLKDKTSLFCFTRA